MTGRPADSRLHDWLDATVGESPDPVKGTRQVMYRIDETPQAGRWMPFPLFRRTARTSTTTDTIEHQPSSIPASNGHTPTVIGRTQTMFSPVKAIIAGTLVFALGGVMLIAQPFDPPSTSVPGAATDDPAMAPSFFSGTFSNWTPVAAEVRVERDDGVVENDGGGYTFDWIANDPRILGTATIISNEVDYREGATMLAPTGDLGAVRTGLIQIANDGGSWEGEYTNLQIDNLDLDNAAGWLTGTGAYEGLSAYLVLDFGLVGTFHGHITPSGPPPAPESLPG